MAASSILQPRHVFGAQGDTPDLLRYVDEETLIYNCGHNLVIYQPENKIQRFIPASADSKGISAIAVCRNKKVVAVAEQGDRPSVTIVDLQTLKRRKVLTLPESASKEFVSISFSSDGKFLAAQTGDPDWTLTLWSWEKSKLVATSKAVSQPGQTVVQCQFSAGHDDRLISVIGEGICKLYRIESGNTLKLQPNPLAKHESHAYSCHAWLVDNDAGESYVVGTSNGEVLIVQDSEIKQSLKIDNEQSISIDSVAALAKGFVVGSNAGTLYVFARENESKPYRLERTFQLESAIGPAASESGPAAQQERVTAIAPSPAEDGVAVLTNGRQLLLLGISSGEKNVNMQSIRAIGFVFVCHAFAGLATCVRRPIFATSSADLSIRIWNHQDKSLELAKTFEKEPLSLALHPTGYMMVAGFSDKLRFMTVLADDLRVIKEFPLKACHVCCFSNGGHYFAAISNNTVHIYNTYTSSSIGVLRVWWSSDDTALVTAGVDGAIYQWRTLDGKREKEFVQKGWTYTGVVGIHGNPANPLYTGIACGGPSTIICTATDNKMRILENSSTGGLAVVQEVDTGDLLSHVIAPGQGGRLLFATDNKGCLRAYKFPICSEHQSQRCSLEAISRIAVNYDETLVFAATNDGHIFMYDVKDKDPGRTVSRKEEILGYAEEVLAGRSDISDKQMRMSELEAQVAEVTAQNEYQLKLKDLALNEKVKELTDKAEKDAILAKERYDALLIDRNRSETQYEEHLNKVEEKYQAQLAALDNQYQQKLICEMERYQELLKNKDNLSQRWEAQMAQLLEQHEKVVDEVKSSYEHKLLEQEQHHESLRMDMLQHDRECKELQRQTEEDADKEVEELKERWKKQVLTEKEAALRLKGENGLLRKKFDEQQKAVDDSKVLLRLAETEKKQLNQVIDGLHRDVTNLHKEVANRDDVIADKEKRIMDLKRKTQELEKFKFVLEYKCSELRSQIEPKDAELADAKDKMQLLEVEKQAIQKRQQETELGAAEHKMKGAALQKELQRQRLTLAEAKQQIRQIQRDIHAVSEHIQQPDKLKAAVTKLYQAHVKEDSTAKFIPEESTDSTQSRQQELLQKKINGLQEKIEDDRRTAAATHRRLVAENAELIKEINQLRREIDVCKK